MPSRPPQPIASRWAGGQRLGHQHVVVDRHERRAPAAASRRCTRTSRRSRAPPRRSRRPRPGPSTRPARRAEPPRPASPPRSARRAARPPSASPHASFAGLTITHRSGPPRTPARKRGEWTCGLDRLAVEERERRSPCAAASSTYSCSPSTCHGSVATSSVPVSSSSASMPSLRTNATSSRRLRTPSASSTLELVGEVEEPVVEAVGQRRGAEPAVAAAGALSRPGRPRARRRAAPGSASSRRIAVHSPVNPPPMIATSAAPRPSSGGRAGPGSPRRYQNEPPAAPACLVVARAGGTPGAPRGAGPSPAQCTRIRALSATDTCGIRTCRRRAGRYSC